MKENIFQIKLENLILS